MRLVLVGVIVPSLLFVFGCQRRDTTASATAPSQHLTPKQPTTFDLTDIDGRATTLTLREGRLELARVVQPTIVLHLFSTRADVCRAMLPYLSDLQHARAQNIFVVGLVAPETLTTEALRTYMRQNNATFFIANPPQNASLVSAITSVIELSSELALPLTVIFDHGHYITHYEGVTPIEMIRSDLNALHHPQTKEKRHP